MEPLLQEFPEVTFDLFHGGYPWIHEVAALAHNYPNVRLNLTWLPHLSTEAAVGAIKEWLQARPQADRISWVATAGPARKPMPPYLRRAMRSRWRLAIWSISSTSTATPHSRQPRACCGEAVPRYTDLTTSQRRGVRNMSDVSNQAENKLQVGVALPQGWMAEYANWEPALAWHRLIEIAQQADELGFESLWVVDHFLTNADRNNAAPTFESFAVLAGVASMTRHIRLGHAVVCAGFRNPALMTKAISTIDVISGGRIELGIGAGWNESEYRAYGYEFPDAPTRLQILRESLEIIGPLLSVGNATHDGHYVRTDRAVNAPIGLQQPRIPIVVGGNGPNVTWRIAAKYADELNLDGMSPAQAAKALPVIKQRCEELGRDPGTLRVSVNFWSDVSALEGSPRVELIQQFQAWAYRA